MATLLKFKKKYTPERWKNDKQKLIDKYNELGYRDAYIVSDTVWNVDDRHVSMRVKVDEGKKYYVRNITWVGNTIYSSDYLAAVLGMKKGDVYNQKLMNKRLTEDEDAVGNNYWNNGYLFYSLHPTEVNIVGDSIDLEMRIFEGPQAHINHVRINGNDRLYAANCVQSRATSSLRRLCSVRLARSRQWATSTPRKSTQTRSPTRRTEP